MKTLLLTAIFSFFLVSHATSGIVKSTPLEVGFLTDREKTPSLLYPFVPFVVQNINTQKITVFGNPSSNTHQVCNPTRQAKPSVRADRRYGPSVSAASVSNTTGGASVRADRPERARMGRYGPSVSPASVPRPPDTLPSLSTLHQSIDSFYAQQTHRELLEFKDTKKGEWLKLLPNLGITYTVDGQPRPSISLSSGILYQAKKAKQQRAAKRESIIQANQLEAEKTKAVLAKLLLRYLQLQEEITAQQQRHLIEQEIFRIQEDEYHRLERSPSDYLQAKRTFLVQKQTLRGMERQQSTLELEILQLAHFPTSTMSSLQTFQK